MRTHLFSSLICVCVSAPSNFSHISLSSFLYTLTLMIFINFLNFLNLIRFVLPARIISKLCRSQNAYPCFRETLWLVLKFPESSTFSEIMSCRITNTAVNLFRSFFQGFTLTFLKANRRESEDFPSRCYRL